MQADEARKDLEELRRLRAGCQRPNVCRWLDERIAQAAACLPGERKVAAAVAVTKLTNYAWDQSDKFVKLYVSLPTQADVDERSVKTHFGESSVRFDVDNLDGRNYSFSVVNLLHPLLPEQSYFKAKKGEVALFLRKETAGQHWDHLTVLEKQAKKTREPKFDKDEDPSTGLMNVMKELYESGDDEMKRTIAKAWCQAQDKSAAGLS